MGVISTIGPDGWFDIAAGSVPDTPALVLSEERIRRNVTRAADLAKAAGKRLRPHAKTHKMVEVARMQLSAGACGLQAAKLSEALALSASGARDWLIAYPVVGEQKWRTVHDLATRVKLSVAVDSLDVARGIASAVAGDAEVEVMIEVDTGLHRVGVPAREAGALARGVDAMPGLRVVGVITHEGHVGPHARRDPATADELTARAVAEMRTARDGLRAIGVEEPIISMGSTPTFHRLLGYGDVDEVRPGLYVFLDMNSVTAGAGDLDDIAAVVAATVVSRSPSRGEFVVDAGSKSLSSDIRILPDGSTSLGHVPSVAGEVIRASEEHGIVATSQNPPRVGDRVVVIPNHVCPMINLHDEAVVIGKDNSLSGSWSVAARGMIR